MKKEKKPKKKLTPKEREEKKQHIKKLIWGFVHVISYILSFLFLIVCIIAACSGGCSPKKRSNNVTTPVNDNVPLRINRSLTDYNIGYNVNDFNVDNYYHLYYDFDNVNSISGDMIYRYVSANYGSSILTNVTYTTSELDTLFGQQNSTPGFYVGIFNDYNLPGHGTYDKYVYTIKGFGIVFDSVYKYSVIYVHVYHKGIMSNYNLPVAYAPYDNVTLLSKWKYDTFNEYTFYITNLDDLSALRNSIFYGLYFHFDNTFNTSFHSFFYKYFTLEYTKGFSSNYFNFYNNSLWKLFTGGAQVAPGVYGVSSDFAYLTSQLDIYGLFKYNESYYNRIRYHYHVFNEGDTIHYSKFVSTFETETYTIPGSYDYYYTLSYVSFDYCTGDILTGSTINTIRSTTFYINLLEQNETNFYMLINPGDHNNGAWSQLGFVDLSSTTFNIYYDMGYTLDQYEGVNGMQFTTYLASYFPVIDLFYYSIDNDGFITIYSPYDTTTPTGEGNNTGYFSQLFNIFGLAFSSVLPFLSIQLLPGVTIGMLVFAPFFVTMILFVIKLFKR